MPATPGSVTIRRSVDESLTCAEKTGRFEKSRTRRRPSPARAATPALARRKGPGSQPGDAAPPGAAEGPGDAEGPPNGSDTSPDARTVTITRTQDAEVKAASRRGSTVVTALGPPGTDGPAGELAEAVREAVPEVLGDAFADGAVTRPAGAEEHPSRNASSAAAGTAERRARKGVIAEGRGRPYGPNDMHSSVFT